MKHTDDNITVEAYCEMKEEERLVNKAVKKIRNEKRRKKRIPMYKLRKD